MIEKKHFFITGLPRSRTAWFSVLLSMAKDTFCFHEGAVGCPDIGEYINRLRRWPERFVGDSSALAPYYVDELIEAFPEAPWIVVLRDPKEAKAALIASEPSQRDLINDWWPCYMERWDQAMLKLDRSTVSVHCLSYKEISFQTCWEVVNICAGNFNLSPSAYWQLDGMSVFLNRKRFDSDVVPLPGGKAGNPHSLLLRGSKFSTSCEGKPVPVKVLDGFNAREYSPLDFEAVNDWCLDHTGHGLNEERLPPLGIVVEYGGDPWVALFAQLAVDRGVAYLQDPLSRPGLTPKQSRAAFKYAFGALVASLKVNNYNVIVAHTPHAALSRELEANYGFRCVGKCDQLEVQI